MVPIMRLFRNLPALFALVCAATGQGADSIYRKVGDSVVLNPGQPFNAISSATWKHNTDLASEWFGTGNVDCYRDFKGRCSLNTIDGSFTISNLKVEDSGSYTPEINDKVLTALKLQVIKPVPKPTVSVKCNNEETRCHLICEANISPDVGTVKYEWRTGEEVLSNNKELIITTENKESSFICELKNRVSSSSSDGVDNPISKGNPGAAAGLAVVIVFLIVAPALAVIGRFGWYWFKNRKIPTWKEFWCCGKKKAKGNYAESAEGKELLHDASEKSDLEAKIYKDQETNAMRPTETLQIVNENETNISVSDEEHERLYDARETQTSDPTEGEASPIDEKENKTNISESSEEREPYQLASETLTSGPTEGEAPPKDNKEKGGTNISQSTEEANQNPPPVNPVPSGQTEGEALTSDDEEKGDQDQKPAEESPIVNQGDSSTVEQNNKESASEKPKDPDCDPSIVSAEVITCSSQTEGEAPPGHNEEKGDQDEKSADESPIENQGDSSTVEQNNKESETNISGSSEGANQNRPPVNSGTGGPTEGEASSRENKDKAGSESKINNQEPNEDDEDSSSDDKKKDEKPKDPDCDPSIVSAEVSAEPDTSNLKSAEEANQNRPSVSPETGGPPDVKVSSSDEKKDEDKDLPNNCKKTDDQGKESAEKSSGVKLGEQHLNSNSNRIQQPYDGTENTSETPSGPETSEEGSADQDQS